jgi:hypothetical protein
MNAGQRGPPRALAMMSGGLVPLSCSALRRSRRATATLQEAGSARSPE